MSSPREATSEQPWLVWTVAVLTGLAILRLVALHFNATDLYTDEAQYWSWSRELALGYYSKPPLLAAIIAATVGVCGDGEACVRSSSLLFHTATALIVFALGRALYEARVGFWSAIVYATLPAVSLSSGIISTDAPLLTAWALSLFSLHRISTAPSIAWAAILGLAIGVGLNAKYAMAYFVVCAGLYVAVAPAVGRPRVRELAVALTLALALIAPNLVWNAQNSFATFTHTADNAGWHGSLFHPDKAAEFVAAQFGVFGPILFGGF